MKKSKQNSMSINKFYRIALIAILIFSMMRFMSAQNSSGLKSILKSAIEKQMKMPDSSKIYYFHFNNISSQFVQAKMMTDTNDIKMYISKSRILFVSSKLISLQTDSILYTIVPPKKLIVTSAYDRDNFIKNNIKKQIGIYNQVIDDTTSIFNFHRDSITNKLEVICEASSSVSSYDKIKFDFELYDDEILHSNISYYLKGELISSTITKTLEINRKYQFRKPDFINKIFLADSLAQITGLKEFQNFLVYDNRSKQIKNNN